MYVSEPAAPQFVVRVVRVTENEQSMDWPEAVKTRVEAPVICHCPDPAVLLWPAHVKVPDAKN